MPIFEYLCHACGNLFEKLQKSTDAPPPACPACGSSDTKRELSPFATPAPSSTPGSCSGGN